MGRKCEQFLIDTVRDGFQLHQQKSGRHIKTLHTSSAARKVAICGDFGEGCGVVVLGGESGKIHIFDREKGDTLDVLSHKETGSVDIVAVSAHHSNPMQWTKHIIRLALCIALPISLLVLPPASETSILPFSFGSINGKSLWCNQSRLAPYRCFSTLL